MDSFNSENRKDGMMSLAKHIDKALTYHRDYHHGFMYSTWKRFSCSLCCTVGQRSGNYLAFGYVLVKLLYIINAIGQLFLLNVFMGNRFHMYGFEILQKWFYGQKIEAVERFPRITMCRYIIRTLGDNIQPYDVQCLLPINIYNEKIFLLIWFWLAFVAAASIYGLIKWLYYFSSTARKNFIRRFLKANGISYDTASTSSSTTGIGSSNGDHEKPRVKSIVEFVDSYCQQDGLLLLRIIKKNTNNVIAGEVVCALWNNWKVMPKIRFNASPESDNGGQIIGLGVKSPLNQNGAGEGNEKLLPPMSGILS